jgi:pimeloyl-ACP methyl ester carboxylesterase
MAEVKNIITNDIEMDYFTFGNGRKILVMLPGLSIQSVLSAADAVEDAYKAFCDEFTIYLFDRRKNLPPEYSIHDMAKDTATVIKDIGLKDIYLFGASQGGMIAMTIAIEYPDLVKKLVLGSTSSNIKPDQQRAIDEWIRLAKAGDKEGLDQAFGKEVYPPDVYGQYNSYFTDVSKTVTDKELERFLIIAESIRHFNVTSDLKKISCPVLALGVCEDAVLDSDATMEIAENLDYRDDFRLYMYTGFGHAAFDTAPDYKDRVLKFFLG